MPSFLKEHRCKHCHKLFFKGDLKHCTIEIKCKNCKNISTFEGINCKLFLLADKESSYKRSDGTVALKDNPINNAIIQCEGCRQVTNCGHYKTMKENNICPVCQRSMEK